MVRRARAVASQSSWRGLWPGQCVVAILIPSLALLILLRPQSASAFDEQAGGQKEAPATAETRAEAARRAPQNEAAKAVARLNRAGSVRPRAAWPQSTPRIGELQHQQGRLTDAENSYTSAIQLAEKLRRQTAQPDSQRSLARNYANLAVVEQRLDRWEDAEASYRKAIATQAKLVATQPEVADNSGMLASLHFYFGIARHNHGNLLVAEQSLTKAIELFTSLIEVQPAMKP